MIEENNKEIVKEELKLDGLKIHQMPKKYRSGSFNYSEYSEKILHKKTEKETLKIAPENNEPHKKNRLIVIFVGILFLVALVFGAYWYLKDKDFSLKNLFIKKVDVPTAPSVIHKETQVNQNDFIPTSTSPIIDDLTTNIPDGLEPIVESIAIGFVDTDNDGLSDSEELVLGTNPNNRDTDNDSYSDYTELINLYNPGAAGGNIYSMPKIKKYQNNDNKYFLAYASDFKVESIDQGASIIFKATDESFIQVIVQDYEGGDSIETWYEKEFLNIATPKQLFTLNDFSGVRSLDGLTIYFTSSAKNKLYIISYTPLDPAVPNYINIMEMMLNSFTLIK